MELWRQAMVLDMEIHMIHTKCNFMLAGDKGLHPAQIMTLLTMKAMGAVSQRRLAKELNCSPASIGVSVKRLEKAELVRKEGDPKDLRATKIVLTQRGLEVAKVAEAVAEETGLHKYANFSEEELTQLNHYMKRIRDNLSAYQQQMTAKKDGGGNDEK